MHRAIINLVKRGGVLIPLTAQDKKTLDTLTASVKEGAKVETFLNEQEDDNHSLSQLAKFHAVVRDIAREVGSSPEDTKIYIKREAGLTTLDKAGDETYRSLKDCSKTEVSVAIQVALRLAELLNIPENGTPTTH